MWLRRLDRFDEPLQRVLEGEADRLLLPPFAAAAATRTTLSFLLSLFFALVGTEQLSHKGCACLAQQPFSWPELEHALLAQAVDAILDFSCVVLDHKLAVADVLEDATGPPVEAFLEDYESL